MPQSPPTTTAANLRMLRTVHGALILSIFFYLVVLKEIPPPPPHPLNTALLAGLGVVSAAAIAIGLMVRSKMIARAYETLRQKPDDGESLIRWRKGAVTSAALAESVVLYGVLIYLIGGPSRQAAPFFAAGTIVMLLWWPKQP